MKLRGGAHSPVRMLFGKFPQLEYGFGLKWKGSCGSRGLCCTKGTWKHQSHSGQALCFRGVCEHVQRVPTLTHTPFCPGSRKAVCVNTGRALPGYQEGPVRTTVWTAFLCPHTPAT